MVELLLQHGADVKAESTERMSPLSTAIENLKPPRHIISLLIRWQAPAKGTKVEALSPLLRAIRKGQTDTIKLLLQHGAEVGSEDGLQKLASLAVKKDDEEMAALILDKDLAVGSCLCPIVPAVILGHCELVKLLLEEGADVASGGYANLGWDMRDGEMPSHVTRATSQESRVGNADGNKPRGPTLLHIAAMNGSVAMVDLLLDWKANLMAVDENGETASTVARRWGRRQVTDILAEKEAYKLRTDIIGD